MNERKKVDIADDCFIYIEAKLKNINLTSNIKIYSIVDFGFGIDL